MSEAITTTPEKELDYMSLVGEGYTITVSPEAETQKLELLAESGAITIVNTPEKAEEARLVAKKLARIRIDVEAARKKVIAPITKKGKEINEIAADFILKIQEDETRLTQLIGTHAAEVEKERQAAIARQKELERQMEQQRIEAERKAEAAEAARLKAIADAEAARVKALKDAEDARIQAEKDAAEAAKAAETAPADDIDAQIEAAAATDRANEAARKAQQAVKDAEVAAEATRIAAQKEAERVHNEAVAANQELERAQLAARQNSLVGRTAATTGVKFDYDYEVEDIGKFFAAYPGLCDLTVKRKETIAFVKAQATANGTVPVIPGLKIEKKPVVSKR